MNRGFFLHSSNRLEEIADALARVLHQPLPSPLDRETVVVQSRGMARWVSQRIAQSSGICMNFEFPFPRTFLDRTLRAFFPSMAPEEEFAAEVLVWKIQRLIPSLLGAREFVEVKTYLEGDDGLKAFQLATMVAHLFDQYLVYRPEMLTRWERGKDPGEWQAGLWRALAAETGAQHLAAVSASLEERMASTPSAVALPHRVSFFGISTLPPLHLRVLFSLSRHCEVHLFVMQPSREYFGDDLTPKSMAKRRSKLAGQGAAPVEFSAGHPLLTSMGKLNRDFTELRLELDERANFVTEEPFEAFIEPEGDDMLHVLQRDILEARARGDLENPALEVRAGDPSIQLHACHSPMREVEVLYDQLLALFETLPGLQPRDILVMTPDIEKYGPLIEAVFGYPEQKERHIPYSVADRRPRNLSPVLEAFSALLDLPGGRCTATDIFSILERAPIRKRFGFADEDLGLIRQWIVESGIRWGMDGKHRGEFDLPALEANTWRSGLNRLLLGFAMPGRNRTTFEGILPYDEVEGDGGELLGRLISAIEALFNLIRHLPSGRPLGEWPPTFGLLLDAFFMADDPENVADLGAIRSALDRLRRNAGLAGSDQPVSFRVIRSHLTALLDQREQRGGFLTGGVTFCALQPMRSIPARVVCLLGMDDQAFPRQTATSEFDLMASQPQCGDRLPRDDDRYVFLEAWLSARERFYCSYVGRSIVDNAVTPPSVLVSELLDCLDQTFRFAEDARAFVVTEHLLHAFSPRYFQGGNLFSYSEANAAASRSLQSQWRGPGFLSGALPASDPETKEVELPTLIQFFANPARHFLRQRLNVQLDEQEDALEDHEPFDLEGLGRYQLRQDLVKGVLEDRPLDRDQLLARGQLPMGGVGVARFCAMEEEAAEFCRRVKAELEGRPAGEPLLIDVRVGPFSLSGRIESIYGDEIVQFRCAALKAKDQLRAWITHLARCAADPDGARITRLIGSDKVVRFLPVPQAGERLARLLEFHREGLSRPLPFFPATALEFATATLTSSKSKRTPLEKARSVWDQGRENRGEKFEKREAAYYEMCFGDGDPLDAEFEELALAVFEPMLPSMQP